MSFQQYLPGYCFQLKSHYIINYIQSYICTQNKQQTNRIMNHYHNNQLHRVHSFQSIKVHNCPHCNCHSGSQKIERPSSPHSINNHNIMYTKTPSICVFNKPYITTNVSPINKEIRQQIRSPNIYYQRTDRNDSQNSVKLNRSTSSRGSSHQNKIIIDNSPPKNVPRINIRYLSPQVQINSKRNYIHTENKPFSPQKTAYFHTILPSVYFEKNQIPNPISHKNSNKYQKYEQKKQILQYGKQQNIPRVPSILKRKSPQNRNIKFQSSPIPSQQANSKKIKQVWNFQDSDSIQIRKAIKSSIEPTINHQVAYSKGEPSSCDLLLDQEQQRLIAIEISRDLKLHYDYLQSSEISKLSTNIYS